MFTKPPYLTNKNSDRLIEADVYLFHTIHVRWPQHKMKSPCTDRAAAWKCAVQTHYECLKILGIINK